MSYRIGCDIDGILADFSLYWTSLLRSMFGTPLHTHETLPGYDLVSHYPELRGKIREAHDLFYQTPNVWEAMPSLLTGWQWGRLAAAMQRWEFHFITARREEHRGDPVWDQTLRWLEGYLPRSSGMIRLHHVPYDQSGPQKADVCRDLGILTMIDEHPDAIGALTEAGIHVTMRVYPYNGHIRHPRVWRVPDFDAILDFLEAF